jgi:hypothetical protein
MSTPCRYASLQNINCKFKIHNLQSALGVQFDLCRIGLDIRFIFNKIKDGIYC